MILESTPEGVGGCFLRGVAEGGRRRGWCGIFFRGGWRARYRAEAVDEDEPDRGRAGTDGSGRVWIWSRSGFGGRCGRTFAGWRGRSMPRTRRAAFWPAGIRSLSWSAIEERMHGCCREPAELRRNGEMEMWLPPLQGKQYLVAVDPAGGGSEGDYSAAQVLEMETGLQCAEFAGHSGRAGTGEAGDRRWPRNTTGAWLVVERNNHGTGVLALAETVCGYGRIYRARRAGGMADDVGEPAGGAGAAGCGAGGGAGALHEPGAAGRVQELCAPAGRQHGSAERGRTTTG